MAKAGDVMKFEKNITTTTEENQVIAKMNMELFDLPRIDLHDPVAVHDRIVECFGIYAAYDYKPTVSGLGLALNGMDRKTLWAIANDKPTGGAGYKSALPTLVADEIKKAYKYLASMHELYMVNGKINPVSGIFLAKNNFGYQDKVEIEASSKQEIASGDYGSVADRYKGLPED